MSFAANAASACPNRRLLFNKKTIVIAVAALAAPLLPNAISIYGLRAQNEALHEF